MKKIAIALIAVVCASSVFGTALTTERNTPSKAGKEIVIGVLTNTRVFAGSMVAVSNQFARPAQDLPGLQVVGRAAKTVDNRTNTDGAGTSGVKSVTCDIGIFRWEHTVFTDQHIGDYAYVVDDQTVTNSGAANDIVAGVIVDVDSVGVWVRTGDVADKALAGTTLTLSGAAAFSGSVTMSGGVNVTTKPYTNSSKGYITQEVVVSDVLTVSGVQSNTGAFSSSSDISIDGKYAAVGPAASSGQMIQVGTTPTGTNGTGVCSFAVNFNVGATPSVVIVQTARDGTSTNIPVVTATASNKFQFMLDGNKTATYIAIGNRP